jgi:hypothetical protein
MPIPPFNHKDWEEIGEYVENMNNWVISNEGENFREKELSASMIGVVTAIAFLKAQESSEALTIELAKSQQTMEYFTLLILFLTLSLVFSLIYSIGAIQAAIVIVIAAITTCVIFVLFKRKEIINRI